MAAATSRSVMDATSYSIINQFPTGAPQRAPQSKHVQTPCRRRKETSPKTPPDGNIRPRRNLWPKNLFRGLGTPLASPAPRRGRLSFHAGKSILLTDLVAGRDNASRYMGHAGPCSRVENLARCFKVAGEPVIMLKWL
jgi:hypothetical protein